MGIVWNKTRRRYFAVQKASELYARVKQASNLFPNFWPLSFDARRATTRLVHALQALTSSEIETSGPQAPTLIPPKGYLHGGPSNSLLKKVLKPQA